MNDQYRQGDVLLVRIDGLPPNVAPTVVEDGSIVLAYGEATGHAHRLAAQTAVLHTLGDNRYLEVKEPTDLTHEEHSPLNLVPGIYKVVRQREYSPQRIQHVAD
jgi:hypothetical protein